MQVFALFFQAYSLFTLCSIPLTDNVLYENEIGEKIVPESKNGSSNLIPGFEMDKDTFTWFCIAIGVCLFGVPILYFCLPRCIPFPQGCITNLCLPCAKCSFVILCFPCLCIGKNTVNPSHTAKMGFGKKLEPKHWSVQTMIFDA